MSAIDEIKTMIDDQAASWKEFKTKNDERFEALEKKAGRPNLGGDAKPDANDPEVKSL